MPRAISLPKVAAMAWVLILLATFSPARADSLDPVDHITEQIVCDCGCSNLTVRNCTCGRADQVRAEVATELRLGKTPDQIVQAYVAEFGEQILASPTRVGFNLVGWFMPFVVVLAGSLLLLLVLRKWSRVSASEAPLLPPLGTSPPPPPDPSFLKRVEEEMNEMDR